jgi:hypothetical protein
MNANLILKTQQISGAVVLAVHVSCQRLIIFLWHNTYVTYQLFLWRKTTARMYKENIKILSRKWHNIIHFTSFTLNCLQKGLNIYRTRQRILTTTISIATYQLFPVKRQISYPKFHRIHHYIFAWLKLTEDSSKQLYVHNL